MSGGSDGPVLGQGKPSIQVIFGVENSSCPGGGAALSRRVTELPKGGWPSALLWLMAEGEPHSHCGYESPESFPARHHCTCVRLHAECPRLRGEVWLPCSVIMISRVCHDPGLGARTWQELQVLHSPLRLARHLTKFTHGRNSISREYGRRSLLIGLGDSERERSSGSDQLGTGERSSAQSLELQPRRRHGFMNWNPLCLRALELLPL